MGLKVYEYECPAHGRVEMFESNPAEVRECPNCGLTSPRALCAPRSKLEGWSGAFPTAADKWARMHYEAAKKKD